MISKPQRSTQLLLILFTNLLPLYYFYHGSWTVFTFYYLFLVETVIISFFSSLQVATSTGKDFNGNDISISKRLWSATKFFIARIGLLCFYLLFLIAFILAMNDSEESSVKSFRAFLFLDDQFNIAVAGFILSHGFNFVFNHLMQNDSRQKSPDTVTLFFDSRIIVIHVSIVLGAFSSKWFSGYNIGTHTAGAFTTLCIFLLIKILNDVFHAVTDNGKSEVKRS